MILIVPVSRSLLSDRDTFFECTLKMARWPDNFRANLVGFALIFVLLPLLCWLAWRWVNP